MQAFMNEYTPEPNDRTSEVWKAWRRWQNAMAYFDNVTDPELVEFAIFDLEAARRQYMYLVKQTRADAESKLKAK